MAQAMDSALSMPVEERRERHQAMLSVMRSNSLERWRDRFAAIWRRDRQMRSRPELEPGRNTQAAVWQVKRSARSSFPVLRGIRPHRGLAGKWRRGRRPGLARPPSLALYFGAD